MKHIDKLAEIVNIPLRDSCTSLIVTGSGIRLLDLEKREDGEFYLRSFVDAVHTEDNQFTREVSVLLSQISRKNKIKGRTISVLGADKSLVVRQTQAPKMGHDELVESLKLTETEALPYPMENAELDAYIIPGQEEAAESVRVIMAAMDKNVARKYHDVVSRAGLRHISITAVPSALEAIIEHSKIIDKTHPVPIISISKNFTGVYIFHEGTLKFTRDIGLGGDQFAQHLAGEYEVGNERVFVTYEEAEQLKRIFGIPRGETLYEMCTNGITGEMVLEKLQPVLERMVTELGRSIDYYKNEQQQYNVPAAYMIGSVAMMKNLPEYLTEALGYRFAAYNPFDDFIKIDKPELEYVKGVGSEYVIAAGVALDHGSRLNLLAPKYRYTVKNYFKKMIPAAAAVTYLILATGIYIGGMQYKASLTAKIADLDTKIAGLKQEQELGATLEGKTIGLRNEITAIETRMTIYPELQGRDFDWKRIYGEVGRLVPMDAALNRMEIRFDNAQEIASDGEMYSKQLKVHGKIRGKANEQVKTIQQFLQKMDESSAFRHATLIKSNQSMAAESEGMLMFEVAADIRKRNQ